MLLRCACSGRSPHVDGWAYVTLHHTSEGLVTSRCYFWIQCWCNGGLADSATATSFFLAGRPDGLNGRLHAAATFHYYTAMRRETAVAMAVRHWCAGRAAAGRSSPGVALNFQVTVSLDACIDMRCAATHICPCPASTRRARHIHTHGMLVEGKGRGSLVYGSTSR